jgi:hypothetical protein
MILTGATTQRYVAWIVGNLIDLDSYDSNKNLLIIIVVIITYISIGDAVISL